MRNTIRKLYSILTIMLIAVVMTLLLSACGSTNTITEYDSAGHIVKTIETKESVAEQIVSSTKDKTVLVTREVYVLGLSLSPASATTESFLSGECVYAHKKTAIASIHKDHNIDKIPEIFSAMQKTDSVGISATGINSGTSP